MLDLRRPSPSALHQPSLRPPSTPARRAQPYGARGTTGHAKAGSPKTDWPGCGLPATGSTQQTPLPPYSPATPLLFDFAGGLDQRFTRGPISYQHLMFDGRTISVDVSNSS